MRYLVLLVTILVLSRTAIARCQEAPRFATLNIAPQDEHRLHETLDGARRLLDSGAIFEATRVLAGIAILSRESDPGREAAGILEELGLSVELFRNGSTSDLQKKVEQAVVRRSEHLKRRREHEAANQKIRTLLALRQFGLAAETIDKVALGKSPDQVQVALNETLEHARLPLELLTDDSPTARTSLIERLRKAVEEEEFEKSLRLVHLVDDDAAGSGHYLLQVTRPDSEEHSAEHISAVSQMVLQQAKRVAEEHPESALPLLKLVSRSVPKSPIAKEASALSETIKSKLAPVPKAVEKTDPHARRPTGVDVANEFFSKLQVHKYDIQLSDESLELLSQEPRQYVRATFRDGSRAYEDVGVRLKGGWTFREFDGEAKVSWSVKFNQFDRKQRFHGLRRIILNGALQDPSFLNETIGYGLFRDAGIPAPRTNYATVRVNGEAYGLYVQIEAVTQDFLKRWYKKSTGNLYEGPDDVLNWRELDKDSNQDRDDRTDLRQLAEAIERADDVDPWQTISQHVDMNKFARFLAMESILGHWDGYTDTNNYRLYSAPATGKFEFIPHGIDQVLGDLGHDIFRPQNGILGRALLQTESGRVVYKQALRDILKRAWNEDRIRQRVWAAYRVVSPYTDGPGKQVVPSPEFEEHVRRLVQFVENRRILVEAQLDDSEGQHSWRVRREGSRHRAYEFIRQRW